MEDRLSIDTLFRELRRYAHMRLHHARVLAVEKCAYLLAILAFACIAGLFIAIAICYLSYSFVHLLQIYMGAIAAHATVAVVLLLIVMLLYRQRRCWILDPMARLLSHILIDDEELK